MTKRTFKRAAVPAAANANADAFIAAAPYQSEPEAAPVKAQAAADGQLHVLMPKADILALKRAALDRGTTVSELVRSAVQKYIDPQPH